MELDKPGGKKEKRREKGRLGRRSQLGPPVLCTTFSLTLPCFPYSLPPPPPQLIHTDTQGPADLEDIAPASLSIFFTLMHAS